MERFAPDDDAMDLEDMHPPEDGATGAAAITALDEKPVAAASARRDWNAYLRERVPKRRRPHDWGLRAADADASASEPAPKLARCGDVSQVDLDAANKPFEAALLRELHFRAHHPDAPLEVRNQALAELTRLQRNLSYYQFRMGEAIALNSARMHPLLGDPLLVDLVAYPTHSPDDGAQRAPISEETGSFRRIAMYPAITVDLRDEAFIAEIGHKRRLTVHLPNMEWAEELRHLALQFGADNVAAAFRLADAGLGTDLKHFLSWLVGQTCYLTLRTSTRNYWYHQEFKFVEQRCNPFGDAQKEYMRYILDQHLYDQTFKDLKPREYETLYETWATAMQSLEMLARLPQGPVVDTNFPRTDWMPDPIKHLLARLARDCIDPESGFLFWHPSWSALDYCLLFGEWYLTAS